MTDKTESQDRQGETITLYEALGGGAGVRARAHGFCGLWGGRPEPARGRASPPPDLPGSEEKLYESLAGGLGGPPIYTQKRGPPMLRRRHFVAPIGPAERDEWLLCFVRALEETVPGEG